MFFYSSRTRKSDLDSSEVLDLFIYINIWICTCIYPLEKSRGKRETVYWSFFLLSMLLFLLFDKWKIDSYSLVSPSCWFYHTGPTHYHSKTRIKENKIKINEFILLVEKEKEKKKKCYL